MSDCTYFEKPASGAAKNFPEERKKPSPVNQGKAGKRPHPALRATFPSQGKAFARQKESMSLRGGPSGRRGSLRSLPGAPLPGRGKALMGIFLSVSVLGSVHSISREMSSAYLRKKSGPLSRNSSTDTPSSSSAWQAGSSRGRLKSPCIRRIR